MSILVDITYAAVDSSGFPVDPPYTTHPAAAVDNFSGLVDTLIGSVARPLITLIIGAAVLFFLIGVFNYLRAAGDESKRKDGATMMTYGIIALFVMVSVWGLVYVVQNTFNLPSDNPLPVPRILD